MSTLAPLSQNAVKNVVDTWFAKLDVHAPVEEVLPLLLNDGLEMRFPEGTFHSQNEFIQWYEGVTRKFFNETHTLKELHIQITKDQASIQLVVNWQAHIWNPPAPKSQWIGFDASQHWVVHPSEQPQQLVIAQYIVDALTPMPGSTTL